MNISTRRAGMGVALWVAIIALVVALWAGVLFLFAWVIRIVASGLFDRDLSIGLSLAVAFLFMALCQGVRSVSK